MKARFIIILITGVFLLLACEEKKASFVMCSNPDHKVNINWEGRGSYNNGILVKNWPRDSIGLYKMMINYLYDNKIVLDTLARKDHLKSIYIYFFKYNRTTKNAINNKTTDFDFFENYLGQIFFLKDSWLISRNCGKWLVFISRNLGYTIPNEGPDYPARSTIVLDDQCDTNSYEKDNEIVRYYHELFDKSEEKVVGK